MAKGSKRQVNRANRRGMLLIAVIVVFLLLILAYRCQKLIEKNKNYETRQEELEQEIRDEEIRAEEIENMKSYIYSDEYIEKIAREKLGLVYSDEIIFQAEE